MPAYYILVSNKNKFIDSITFYFQGIIDDSFFKSFIVEFGKSDNIQLIDNVKVLSKGEYLSQYLKKSFIETREGSFEENSLYNVERINNSIGNL